MSQSGGPVRNAHRIIEGLATGGNVQEGTDEETVGSCGEIITADFWGR